MVTTVLALLVLAGFVLYLMTPDERAALARAAMAAIRDQVHAALERSSSGEPFDDFLRARTGQLIVTPLLIAVNVLVFVGMLFGEGALGDVQTLVNWGGNFAPRTTNGEWWRLMASTFVHGGMLHLVATIAGLVPLGLVLERAAGRFVFASVYLGSGLLASVVSLWTTSPTGATAGASGAIFGIYGLLLASLVWSIVSRPPVPAPVLTVKRIAAAGAVFVLYNLATDYLNTASELTALGTGFVTGLVVARGVTREKPPVRRAAAVMAATALIAIACVIPLRGIVDVRPEIAHIAVVEERTAGEYDAAVDKFKRRRITAEALAQLIDRKIIPELQAVRARLKTVRGIPREQEPIVAAAEEYFRLREQTWRRRAEGLNRLNDNVLREAEKTERAALAAFEKLRRLS